MSSYTYIIFTCSHLDEIGEHGITMLLPLLEKQGLPSLERSREGAIYTMCGNYLPFTDLVAAVESVPWEITEEVQLFHKHESADRYEEADLKLKRLKYNSYVEWEWTPDENGQFDEFSQTYGVWKMRRVMIEEPA